MTAADAPQFQAVIVPHRSLGRRGLLALGGAICAFSGIVTAGLLYLGAWPVIGFNGVEIGLALYLIRRHARGVRANEVLTLSSGNLQIVRTGQDGKRTTRTLPTAWLQVLLEERRGRVPGLLLVHRGLREEVGVTLGEAEKQDLAAALRDALHRSRYPVFDNPHLRTE